MSDKRATNCAITWSKSKWWIVQKKKNLCLAGSRTSDEIYTPNGRIPNSQTPTDYSVPDHFKPTYAQTCQGNIFFPSGCSRTKKGCNYTMTWLYNSNKDDIVFTITTVYADDKWTGVGFSEDKLMVSRNFQNIYKKSVLTDHNSYCDFLIYISWAVGGQFISSDYSFTMCVSYAICNFNFFQSNSDVIIGYTYINRSGGREYNITNR